MGVEIDEAQQFLAFAARVPVKLPGQQAKRIGEDRDGAPPVRIRQGGAGDPAGAEVVMVLAVGVEACLKAAQAGGGRKLREDQRHEMVPAPEPLS